MSLSPHPQLLLLLSIVWFPSLQQFSHQNQHQPTWQLLPHGRQTRQGNSVPLAVRIDFYNNLLCPLSHYYHSNVLNVLLHLPRNLLLSPVRLGILLYPTPPSNLGLLQGTKPDSQPKQEREDGLSIRYFVIILDLGFLNDGKRKTAVQCNVLTTTEALTFPFSGTLISGLTNWLSPSSFMHVPDHPSPSPSSA